MENPELSIDFFAIQSQGLFLKSFVLMELLEISWKESEFSTTTNWL